MLPRKFTLVSTTLILSALIGAVSALGQTVDPQTGAVYNNVAGGMINSQTGGFYPSNGAIDTRTGQTYPSVAGGVLDPSTGQVYPATGQGYVNPQTGQYMPSY